MSNHSIYILNFSIKRIESYVYVYACIKCIS